MSLIVCKKCGGPHITIKCGKEAIKIEQPIIKPESKVLKKKSQIVTIKLSNLPNDLTIAELELLMQDWGRISRINFNKSEDKIAFIDFYYKDEADYFIQAIDRTIFDKLIIRAEYNDMVY